MAAVRFLNNLSVKGTGTVLDIQGTQGQLFSITDSLTGDLFSVSDISGVPILNVNSSGVVNIDGNFGVGTASPVSKLHVYENTSSGNDGAAGITVEQDGTADAIVQYLLTGTRRWVTGIDNSDSDKFKIASSADLGTDTHFSLDVSGNASFSGSVTSGGQITGTELEGTSLDINGNADISGNITNAGWTGDVIASAYLDADTAHLTTTQTFSGSKTFSALASFTMDGNTITGVDDSGEFTDNDSHIMTSAAVNDRIQASIIANTDTQDLSISGQTLSLTNGGSVTLPDTNTVYTHPTNLAGDDINIDTGALTGATVISDLDFNITTNTAGHVTDANATVATRNLTLANLGYSVPTTVSGSSGSCTGNAATVTTNANLTGHITSSGNAAVLGSFTVAQLSAALSNASISGNNTGDQTSVSGASGSCEGNASTATKISSITNSNIVQLAASQTLTNKTIAASQITEISNITASEGAQLENIGSTTISATQWGYLGAATGAITNTNTNTQLSTEAVQDIVGAMLVGTETRIGVSYDDTNGRINFVVDDMTANTNTQLSNAQVRAATAAATDSQVFTDADHTKLNGIETGATADQTSVTGNAGTATLAANSTLAGGLAIGTGRNNSVNQIVRTDGNGYATFGWINTTSGNTTATITDVYVNTNDGYIRKATAAVFGGQIGQHISYDDITDTPTIPSGNQVIDWSASGAGTIHTSNYVENVVQTTVSGSSGSCTGNAATATKISSITNSNIVQLATTTIQTGTKTFSGVIDITNTTDSTNATGDTGALRTEGGASIAKKLYVGSTITGSADVIAYSDERLKKNVKTLDGKKVLEMRGVSFERVDSGKQSSGVIAQEMEKVAPELVIDDGNYKGVAYGNVVGYLIEAIKDQQKQIDELKKLCNGCSK